jgi:tetratricopeptide (TPR) repeat protein
MGQWRGKCIRPILIATLYMAALICVTTAAEAQSPGVDTTVVPPAAAYNAADAAYKAYARGNYAEAVRRARDAVSLAPQNAQYRQLLQTAEQAVQAGVRDQAYRAADAAYKLEAQGNYPAAVTSARRAVALAPGNQAYRRLLVDALANAGHLAEADKVATDALSNDPHDGALLAQRGYIRQRSGQFAEAADDFVAAQAAGLATDAERRNVALALADAALSSKQPQRSVDALQPYANDKTYAVASRRAFALLGLGEKEEALSAFSSAADLATTAQERATMTKAEINLLADLGRRADATALFEKAKAAGALDGASDLDIAYLAVRLGDDTTATALFSQAKAAGNLTGPAMLDAGYAAKRSVDNADAIADFKAAIDANAEGKLPLSQQSLFETRREVAELERTWGAFASLTYGAVGVMPSSSLTPPPVGRILQAGTEVYWRPPLIGYRDGRIFEVFVRSFETLTDATGAPTGAPTWQGAAGMRVKPFSDFNLVLEGARVFPIGTNARQDWLARVAFSHGDGTDLRYDATNWTMWQIYAEYDRYFQTVENVVAYEARLGRSFRIDAISDRLVATPFLALGGSYDSLFATPSALGAGPGISVRWWFRDDKYTAPMSFIDLNVQYRFKLAGDDRARGVFVGLTLAF